MTFHPQLNKSSSVLYRSEQRTHYSYLRLCCYHLLHRCVWMPWPEKVFLFTFFIRLHHALVIIQIYFRVNSTFRSIIQCEWFTVGFWFKVPVNEEDHTAAWSDATRGQLPSSFPWFSSSVSNHPEYSWAPRQFSRKSTTETNNDKQTNKLQVTLEALSTGALHLG